MKGYKMWYKPYGPMLSKCRFNYYWMIHVWPLGEGFHCFAFWCSEHLSKDFPLCTQAFPTTDSSYLYQANIFYGIMGPMSSTFWLSPPKKVWIVIHFISSYWNFCVWMWDPYGQSTLVFSLLPVFPSLCLRLHIAVPFYSVCFTNNVFLIPNGI